MLVKTGKNRLNKNTPRVAEQHATQLTLLFDAISSIFYFCYLSLPRKVEEAVIQACFSKTILIKKNSTFSVQKVMPVCLDGQRLLEVNIRVSKSILYHTSHWGCCINADLTYKKSFRNKSLVYHLFQAMEIPSYLILADSLQLSIIYGCYLQVIIKVMVAMWDVQFVEVWFNDEV